MRNKIFLLICIFCVNNALAGTDQSSADSIPFYKMSLEQLMNVNVSVVADQLMIGRESPGIVTVVTQEEILKLGARDLMQVLQLIPGFDFAVDVEGVVGIGVRGNWGNEGKVLMLWDGIEMNEELFSTLQFGNHYPVSQIKRIEVIRGPGSAIYGGNAEYAVINITTINSDLNGVVADANLSTFSNSLSSRGVSFAAGKKWKDSHIAFSTNQSKAIRSDRDYIDNYGNDYSLRNLSDLNSEQYRIDFSYKKSSIIAFCDNYNILQRDGYDVVYSYAYRSQFFNSSIHAKSEFAIGKIKFTPGIKFKFEKPWNSPTGSAEDSFEPFNVTSKKSLAYLNYNVEPIGKLNLSGGFHGYQIIANELADNSMFNNGTNRIENYNYGGHIQALFKTGVVNFILGSRLVYNKFYGTSFVPRVGLTKLWQKFHVKVLYSLGYRAPSIENINLNSLIKPEYTSVLELEGGIKFGDHSYLTTNIYDIKTRDPIVFYYDEFTNSDGYKNDSKIGTRGIELDYKWKTDKYFVMLNYSFYTTAGYGSNIDNYLSKESKVNLAFPAHKINLVGNWAFGSHLFLSPSITFYSNRFSVAESNNYNITKHPSSIFGNINATIENFLSKGLTAQLGIFNFTDENILYIQPYVGNHAPLPGGGREYQIRFNYTLPNGK